jgi:hypothetical protein
MTMINKEFDHIVSLGSFCQTAHQIRRHFKYEHAHIFDWWVTPTVGLVELVENGFAELFIEQNMKIVDEPDGMAVMCSRYGLMHYHDFDEAKIAGTLNAFLVRAGCPTNIAKFSYLLKRLIGLSGDVLFIRSGGGYVRNYNQNMEFNPDLLKRFIKAMERILPTANFKILLLQDTSPIFEDTRVFTDDLNNYGCDSWDGSDRGWSELFTRQQVNLKVTNQS